MNDKNQNDNLKSNRKDIFLPIIIPFIPIIIAVVYLFFCSNLVQISFEEKLPESLFKFCILVFGFVAPIYYYNKQITEIDKSKEPRQARFPITAFD